MGFLDNLSKSVSQGIDRAKFEAEKLARIARIQGELAEQRRQIDAKRMDLGDRAYDLYRAGQIQSATIAELTQGIDALRASLTLKEDELKSAQNEGYVEPVPTPSSAAQDVPISVVPPTMSGTPYPSANEQGSASYGKKPCPSCGFMLPPTAMFCPSCGSRVGGS